MKPAHALFLSAALMLGLASVMPDITRITFIDRPSVSRTLPDRIGPWTGKRVLYCQNPEHGRLVLAADPGSGEACPDCGAPLEALTTFERLVLPGDTVADKRQYSRDGYRTPLQAAIVFSGRHRSSIHRPEVCLLAEGSEIVASRTRRIERPGFPPLDVTLLDVQQTRRLPDGRAVAGRMFFAYWFAGRGRETPSHPARMFWMAWDRILHNRAYPWAYISVVGLYDQPGDAPLDRLDAFVRELYPLIAVQDADRS